MDNQTTYDRNTDRLTGIIILLVFITLIINELTSTVIKTDLHGIHDSLKYIGEHYILFVTNTVLWIVNLILLIALAAAFLLALKIHHNTLSHFIAFGFAATGLTIMVAAAGSLSLISITNEYLKATGIESDIIAINGLSIAELRENSFLIAFTFEGLSVVLLGLLIVISRSLPKWIGWISIIGGFIFATFCWQDLNSKIFFLGRMLIILSLFLIGARLLIKGSFKAEE